MRLGLGRGYGWPRGATPASRCEPSAADEGRRRAAAAILERLADASVSGASSGLPQIGAGKRPQGLAAELELLRTSLLHGWFLRRLLDVRGAGALGELRSRAVHPVGADVEAEAKARLVVRRCARRSRTEPRAGSTAVAARDGLEHGRRDKVLQGCASGERRCRAESSGDGRWRRRSSGGLPPGGQGQADQAQEDRDGTQCFTHHTSSFR